MASGSGQSGLASWALSKPARQVTPKYGVLPEASAAPAAFNQALFQHLLDLFKDAGAEVGDAELQEVAFVMAAKLSPNIQQQLLPVC